jgi:putative addiction module component (TIGR02574 family)
MSTLEEIRTAIVHLSPHERMQLVYAIWGSLDNKDEAIESPAWHGEVLAEREAKIQSGQAHFLSLDEVKKRSGSQRTKPGGSAAPSGNSVSASPILFSASSAERSIHL